MISPMKKKGPKPLSLMAIAPITTSQVCPCDMYRTAHDTSCLLYTSYDHFTYRAILDVNFTILPKNTLVDCIAFRILDFITVVIFDGLSPFMSVKYPSFCFPFFNESCCLFQGVKLPLLQVFLRNLKLVFIVVVNQATNVIIIPATLDQFPVKQDTNQIE
ncbi:hypothetical protein [Klebsiella phage DP]|nr:hypothetical protein [Klebsiella phage DP]